jgi:hypothetical protein
MPTLSDIWDLLVKAVSYLFCTAVDFVLGIALVVLQYIFSIMPAVVVPSWLTAGSGITTDSFSLLAFFFPIGFVFWASGVILLIESWYSVVLPLYRGFMDLF